MVLSADTYLASNIISITLSMIGVIKRFLITSCFLDGAKFSFRNLRVRFESNDAVDLAETETKDHLDFTDEIEDDRQEVDNFWTTTIPRQIPGTKAPPYSNRKEEGSKASDADAQLPFSVKAWLSSRLHKTESTLEVDYPINNEIPGLKELLQVVPLIIPHRIRHGHRHMNQNRG